MTKPITSNAATEAAKNYGHEPILVLRIDWPGTKYYADKTLSFAEGRLLDVGPIVSQKKQDNVGVVSVVKVTLDDLDGNLKAIIDENAIEYKTAYIYEHFEGLSFADATLLFKGNIAGPIEWSEGERTLKFEIETKIKDNEVGFSADPNSIDYLNINAWDKAWPLCFGNVVHVPALKLKTSPTGHLKFPFKGPRSDGTAPDPSPYLDDTHCYLLDGEGQYFPQNQYIEVSIDGIIFGGTMNGDIFTVTDPNLPKFQNIAFISRPSDPDSTKPNVAWIQSPPISLINNYIYINDVSNNKCYLRVIRQEGQKIWFDEKAVLTPASEDSVDGGLTYRQFGTGDFIAEVAKNGRKGWLVTEKSSTDPNSADGLQAAAVIARVPWNLQVGTEVTLWKPFHKDIYVANLIPSAAVISVWARKRNKEGAELLTPLPTYYYSTNLNDSIIVNNKSGTVTVHPTTITFELPLRYYEGQRWSDDIYVTLRSTVGPNTSDIIKWLYDTYSSLSADAASFASVATAIDNYPSNFTLFDKQNVVTLCDNIAWQARCGTLIDNGQVFLRYLSKEPPQDVTYSEANIEQRTIDLTFSKTEDIVTSFKATFKTTYYPERIYEKEIYYNKNINVYGYHRKEYNFYIYNIESLVQKSVNFWGYRYANSWRMVQSKFALEALILQIFDCVLLQLTDTSLLNIGAIKSIVESTELDTLNDSLTCNLWLPSLAGTKTVDPNAWLSDGGDTNPGDPTTKYLVTPYDLQLADLESQLRAYKTSNGATTPAIVVSLADLSSVGTPDPENVDTSSTAYTVNEHANGYNEPATKLGVTATPIDPTQTFSKSDKVAVVSLNGKNYIVGTKAGSVAFPAKVTAILTPDTVFQVDAYANGFDQDPTDINIVAYVTDLNSFGFAVNDHVIVIASGGDYYITNTRLFQNNISPILKSARITGGTNPYNYVNTQYPSGPDIAGTGTCYEMNGSTIISAGTHVLLYYAPSNGNLYFFYPAGDCS